MIYEDLLNLIDIVKFITKYCMINVAENNWKTTLVRFFELV